MPSADAEGKVEFKDYNVTSNAYSHMSIGKAESIGKDKINEIFGLKTGNYNSNSDTEEEKDEEEEEKYKLNTISSNDRMQAK